MMKTTAAILIFAFSSVIYARPETDPKLSLSLDRSLLGKQKLMEHYAAYKQYKLQFNKPDVNDSRELKRFMTFATNVEKIRQHNERFNRGEETYHMSVNKFTDMLPEELKKMNGYRHDKKKLYGSKNVIKMNVNKQMPKRIDWRLKGYVTPVKDQGNCGSCWAFSSTGSLEGQHFRKTGKLVSLSEQNLIDCSTDDYGNYGCDGGFMDGAFDYVRDNGGVDTEKSYPYEAYEDNCRYSNRTRGADDAGVVNLPEGDELQLQAALVENGPISVAIDAVETLMQYGGGIYSSSICSPEALNHAVLAVGYGTEKVQTESGTKEIDYWIVKNSWGKSWGENGYFRLARNQNNMCGIATVPCYPIVN